MAMTETNGPRLDWKTFQTMVPSLAKGMAVIAHGVRASGIEAELIELVKVRVSQLNGCAFCVQYHLNDARKVGVAPEKLDLLAEWREAGIFSNREAAALAWAERVTLLAQQHIDDDLYAGVSAHFSQEEIALLTTAIGQINFWNRIAAPFRFTPPIPRAVAQV